MSYEAWAIETRLIPSASLSASASTSALGTGLRLILSSSVGRLCIADDSTFVAVIPSFSANPTPRPAGKLTELGETSILD